ncbi:hypothetical protein DU478_05430 [Thalassococcus profundi]|uniref:Uncharacterized protein n=1 Tax=Thalassococcus profundi TaxID=2282382 RepID=A0A369TPT6_9RHOB|nr:hypothetical protein [Thalassococcus profundi]RDD67180.1 hypothetical protein DU478_05430 [Thalassococcus profundi]
MNNSSQDIAVKQFRQIFTWPFVMSGKKSADEWFQACGKKLNGTGSKWVETSPAKLMPDTARVGKGDENQADRNMSEAADILTGFYEEAVYFHDFIRDSLYKKSDNVKTYQRPSLKRIEFSFGDELGRQCFSIPFTALHLYRSGVAILTLELVHESGPLTLAQCQTLVDRLRRAYPPFWFAPGMPALTPLAATLFETRHAAGLDDTDPPGIAARPLGLKRLQDRKSAQDALITEEFREPLFSWWRALLEPLAVVGNSADSVSGDTRKSEPLLRQVLDERIPLMTTIALQPDPSPAAAVSSISEGDWFRIAGADSAGDTSFPYHPCFLHTQSDALFYDRYLPFEGGDEDTATRLTFAGYHFAAVGSGGFFDSHLTEHVRRHYRHMQHLCLLEFATLLSISQRLCKALDLRDAGGDRAKSAFRQEILEIQNDFMDFTHRYHFTGVSNQLQARELFDRFRDSMELDARYYEIKAELDSAADLARAEEQRAATDAANNLTEVATVAAVIGVAAALTGMNVLFDEEAELFSLVSRFTPLTCANLAFDAMVFAATLLLTTLGASALFCKVATTTLRGYLTWIGFAAALLFLLGLAGFLSGIPSKSICSPPDAFQTM